MSPRLLFPHFNFKTVEITPHHQPPPLILPTPSAHCSLTWKRTPMPRPHSTTLVFTTSSTISASGTVHTGCRRRVLFPSIASSSLPLLWSLKPLVRITIVPSPFSCRRGEPWSPIASCGESSSEFLSLRRRESTVDRQSAVVHGP
jgi:hypothetical protein